MKITKAKLQNIIKEEMNAILSEELERTHNGKVITPKSVAGKLSSLVDEVEALGEDFFSDSDTLRDWTNDFMAKHKIMKEEMSELTESESIGETVDALEKNITAAMDNMERLALHLKQSGMNSQNVEKQIGALQNIISSLDQALQPAG